MKSAFPFNIGTVHIVGIGGIGMSGYAEVLHTLGYRVQGSDQSENANVQRLRARGVTVRVGHAADNIRDHDGNPCAVVVKSTAVKDDNAEIVAAGAAGIPVIPRVELLAEMMRSKWCVNISGTHGKTTTTSMVGHVLERAGLDPTVMNGGIINAYGSNTRLGAGDWMVVEADESDGTFAHLPSVVSVVTNIDPEHLDYYGTFERAKAAFLDYVHNLPFYGVAVACSDHPVVAALLPQFRRRTITYGFNPGGILRAVNPRITPQGSLFDIEGPFETLHDVHLPMFGPHNVLNALAAVGVGLALDLPAADAARALAGFAGVKRRFTTTGIVDGITVIDDYGHHPVEIAAALKAGREAAGRKGRVIAVMQPHRYSRLAALLPDFARCFADADAVIVADVYAAGEAAVPGIDRDALISAIRNTGKTNVHALAAPQHLAGMIHDLAAPGDFVICLGAGSITRWAQDLPHELQVGAKTGHGAP